MTRTNIGIGFAALLILSGCSSSKPAESELETKKPALTKLVVEDVVVGTGAVAQKGDFMVMDYKGTLANGKVFDESKKRNEPFTFTLGNGQVIKGWDEGLVGMKVGGKRKLSIPPSMAYGDKDQGDIPPNSDLYFDVTLIDIVKPEDQDTILQYADAEKPGTGPAIKNGDTVTLKYVGKSLGGRVFDTSESHGNKPFTFVVGKGDINLAIEKAVVGMKLHGKRSIRIPTSFTMTMLGENTPRNQPLKFDLEVVKVGK